MSELSEHGKAELLDAFVRSLADPDAGHWVDFQGSHIVIDATLKLDRDRADELERLYDAAREHAEAPRT